MLHLYIANINCFCREEIFLKGCGMVDAVRLAKTDQCKKSQDKARSLCCGLLLQYALGKALGRGIWQTDRQTEKLEIRYRYAAGGKPYFLDYPQFYFSLSHSGEYAALAFSDRETGLDIQQERPVRRETADRVLSVQEYRRYRELEGEEEKADWFFRCWCAKESYGKLKGTGLSEDSRRTVLSGDGRSISREADRVLCREYRPEGQYYMNVCVGQQEGAESFPDRIEDVTRELLSVII